MRPNLLLIVIYVAVALIVATVLLLLRDLLGRGKEEPAEADRPLDLAALLPSPETAASNAGQSESWLGRLATETGIGFTAETAFLLAIAAGLALGGGFFLWRDSLLAGAAGAVLGVLAVGGLLFFLRARRYSAIREQLPDVIELMARAVRAGESLDQAIALVGNSALRPVAAEFHYCASQMKMGLSLESAIRGMVARVPLAETRILAMTLIVQRRRGGSLPPTLEHLAHVFRDRASVYRQFRAANALSRGSAAAIVLVALGLDVYVFVGQSQYTAILFETGVGRTILAASLALQAIGVIWGLWLFRSNY